MFQLPLEIRQRIYCLVFSEQPPHQTAGGLLLVCRQLRTEATVDFYRSATFSFRSEDDVKRRMEPLGSVCREIRHATVHGQPLPEVGPRSLALNVLATIQELERSMPSLKTVSILPVAAFLQDLPYSRDKSFLTANLQIRRRAIDLLLSWKVWTPPLEHRHRLVHLRSGWVAMITLGMFYYRRADFPEDAVPVQLFVEADVPLSPNGERWSAGRRWSEGLILAAMFILSMLTTYVALTELFKVQRAWSSLERKEY